VEVAAYIAMAAQAPTLFLLLAAILAAVADNAPQSSPVGPQVTPSLGETRPPFNASFEGGNVGPMTRWTGPNELSYKGALKCGVASTTCSPYTNWVYFCVSNLSTTDTTTLIALSTDWCSPPWFSYEDGSTGTDWTRINTTASDAQDSSCGHWRHAFNQPKAFIAFSIPYVPSKHLAQLFSDLPAAAPLTTAVKQFSLATSEGGNDVAAVNISSNWATGGPKRALIWFQARQHAWESGSSWVADGLARFAASSDALAGVLLANADVVVTPIVDVDNVVVGGAGKDQGPVDFNRDWCPPGQVARNETGALCQHWKAIAAIVAAIRDAMSSGLYDTLVFVDSHSPGNPKAPAQVWTECAKGPTAVSPHAWNLSQGYKVLLGKHAVACGRLAYKEWCAEVGPAYGNQYSGYHANEISFMYLFYQGYKALMNDPRSRSMSFSHETSAATVAEACMQVYIFYSLPRNI